MKSLLIEKKYCTNCSKVYTIQAMVNCPECCSSESSTFLVDDRFVDLKQFKANRNLKLFSDMNKE